MLFFCSHGLLFLTYHVLLATSSMVSCILTDIYKAHNPFIYGDFVSANPLGGILCLGPRSKHEHTYRCDLCGKGFADLLQYISHNSSKEQCRIINHHCLICGNGFTSCFNLSKHTSTHNVSLDPPSLRTSIHTSAFDGNSLEDRSIDLFPIGRVKEGISVTLKCQTRDLLPEPGCKTIIMNRSAKLAQSAESSPLWGQQSHQVRRATVFAASPPRFMQPKAMHHSVFQNRDFDAKLQLKDLNMWHSQDSFLDASLAQSDPADIPYPTDDSIHSLPDRTDFVLLKRSVLQAHVPKSPARQPLTVCSNPRCQTLIAEKDWEITRLKASMLQLLRTSKFMSQQQIESSRYRAALSCEVNERVQALRKQVKSIKARSSLLSS